MIIRDDPAHTPIYLDPYQSIVLDLIDKYTGNTALTVTRGHSTPEQQLLLIAFYAQQKGISFPEFDPHDVNGTAQVDVNGVTGLWPRWYRTWGMDLNKGVVINPPLPAVVPYDYFKGGINQRGMKKPASLHTIPLETDPKIKPCPIDFSAKVDKGLPTERVDFNVVQDILTAAQKGGVPISVIVIEHDNGCVHAGLFYKNGLMRS